VPFQKGFSLLRQAKGGAFSFGLNKTLRRKGEVLPAFPLVSLPHLNPPSPLEREEKKATPTLILPLRLWRRGRNLKGGGGIKRGGSKTKRD